MTLIDLENLRNAHNSVCETYKLNTIDKLSDMEQIYDKREIHWLLLLIPNYRDAVFNAYIGV